MDVKSVKIKSFYIVVGKSHFIPFSFVYKPFCYE